MVNKRCICW